MAPRTECQSLCSTAVLEHQVRQAYCAVPPEGCATPTELEWEVLEDCVNPSVLAAVAMALEEGPSCCVAEAQAARAKTGPYQERLQRVVP